MYGIMIQGTSSDVGKSFVCTALCRALSRKGIRVTPFKSQNMSNNSYVTKEGAEISRSQGIQAEAANIEATVMMSPILLKPRNDQISEVVRFGQIHETLSGVNYREHFYDLGIETIKEALSSLAEDYEAIIIEGAGSPVEMNLNDRELVNMKVAELADVPVILVADIDRGGIFASIAGTLQLLSEQERSRVIGVIINKFRGDPALFVSGQEWIETHLHIPVLAVLPHVENHRIESEDSLSRHTRYVASSKVAKGLEIAIIDLPYISNDTDLEPFRYEQDLVIKFIGINDELGHPDAVILPGTQSTMRALEAITESGMLEQLMNYISDGGTIIGISGGYYMLGESLIDKKSNLSGMGVIPIKTNLCDNKQKATVKGSFIPKELQAMQMITGFEIPQGEVALLGSVTSFLEIEGREDGVYLEKGRVIGTHIHHLFHDDSLRTWWLNRLRREKGLPDRSVEKIYEKRLQAYDHIADWLEKELDVNALIKTMTTWRKK